VCAVATLVSFFGVASASSAVGGMAPLESNVEGVVLRWRGQWFLLLGHLVVVVYPAVLRWRAHEGLRLVVVTGESLVSDMARWLAPVCVDGGKLLGTW
jgi:hypothetical protein